MPHNWWLWLLIAFGIYYFFLRKRAGA